MNIVTRFAPSPTGFLHIGGARTALFNYLLARRHGGKFLLRVEDTDRARSTPEATQAILQGLSWLGLDCDDEIIYQHARAERHKAVAKQLLESGKAYKCYASKEELAEMRARAEREKTTFGYDGRWRDRDPQDAPEGVVPVIRLKAPQTGVTTIQDDVQGEISVGNDQLDDFILLRSDESPTYMLAVVVDDHDMGVNRILRGDDHLTNSFRQKHIYDAMGWEMPRLCHVPLIHGQDGAKLSKRHGALGVEAYKDMGILPEALCNYLLRLGWSHGDDELISREEAIKWFETDAIGKSAARFDIDKLMSLNAHYLRQKAPQDLLALIKPLLEAQVDRPLLDSESERIVNGMKPLTERAKDLHELAEGASLYLQKESFVLDEKASSQVKGADDVLLAIHDCLANETDWVESVLDKTLRDLAAQKDLKFGKVAGPLRAAISGRGTSPGVFDLLVALGQNETLERLKSVLKL